MWQRILIALIIAGALALAAYLFGTWQKRRANTFVTRLSLTPGMPGIVYLFSPSCAVCRTSQKVILDKLEAQEGARLRLISIDVSVQPDVARALGVTTLPTTFVVDAEGQIAHVNNGLATEAMLRRQLGAGNS